jgi:hypothetical protein
LATLQLKNFSLEILCDTPHDPEHLASDALIDSSTLSLQRDSIHNVCDILPAPYGAS